MHSRFGWIGTCLLLVVLSLVARASQTYRFDRVEVNPFSVQDGDPDPDYSIMVDGVLLHAPKSELETIRKYMGLKKIEDLKGYSFDSNYVNSAELAFDEYRLKALHAGNYKQPTSKEFFEKIARGLADAGSGGDGKCLSIDSVADNATRTKLLGEAFTKPCGSVKPEFLKSLNEMVSKNSFGAMSVQVSKVKSINGSISSCGEYFHVIKNGRPVVKFFLEGSANGFFCSKAPQDLKADPEPKKQGGKKSRSFSPPKTPGGTRILVPIKKKGTD